MGSSGEHQRAAAGALVVFPIVVMSAKYILMAQQSPLVSIHTEQNYLQSSAHCERFIHVFHPQTFLSLVF